MRGHAVAHQAFQALGGAGEQLVFGRRASGTHGAGDAAAGRGDFRVADALQALLEFTAAVTAEHRVGVAVDQARRDPGPFQIIDGRVFARRQFSARADPLDERTGRHDGRILDDRVDALRHGCDVAVLPESFHPVILHSVQNRFASRLGSHRVGTLRSTVGASLLGEEAITGSAATSPKPARSSNAWPTTRSPH